MAVKDPTPELELQFSSDDATPTPWAQACERLEKAKVYWLSTVHPDGRPHITPIASVWLDDALYFSTGQTERKAKNLELNPHCVITTGCNVLEGCCADYLHGDGSLELRVERVQNALCLRICPSGRVLASGLPSTDAHLE
jgi:hypothetical protein